MIGMLFKVTEEPAVFVASVDRFLQEVGNMKSDIARLASTPAAQLGRTPSGQTGTPFPVTDPKRPKIIGPITPNPPR